MTRTLPFHDRTPKEFEELVVSIAKTDPGCIEARLYGDEGQKQYGIDVIAWHASGEHYAYQARRVRTFNEDDLRRAVDDFAPDAMPYDFSRLVVAVACSTRRTQLLHQLDYLQQTYDFEICLYGKDELEDLLRSHFAIVKSYFGHERAKQFCTDPWPLGDAPTGTSVETQPASIPDVILRGPVEALGLGEKLAAANRLSESDPAAAADLFRVIADKLEGTAAIYARMMRRKTADALAAAGDTQAAGLEFTRLFWDCLDQGADVESQILERELSGLATAASDNKDLAGWADAAKQASNAVRAPLDHLDGLAAAVDKLAPSTNTSAPALVLLCELALVAEKPEFVLERSARIKMLAAESSTPSDRPSLGTRLRLCLAEATGDWSDVGSREETQALSDLELVLVRARRGRFHAWNADSASARRSYRKARDRAAFLTAYHDAAECLHAENWLNTLYGSINGEPNESAQKMQILSAANSRLRVYGDGSDSEAVMLRSIHDEQYQAAARAGYRLLREAVVAGHWGSELNAHILLGALFENTGDPGKAAHHYMRAGAHERIASLLRFGPFVDVRSELALPAPWVRATAYVALATEADFVPDCHVDEIVAAALDDAESIAEEEVRLIAVGPDLRVSALAALGALVERASTDHAHRVLRTVSSLLGEKTISRRTADHHMNALAGVFRGHPLHRQEALSLIGKALENGGSVGDAAATQASYLLANELAVRPMLEALASDGNDAACRILAAHGHRTGDVLRKAEEALDKVRNPPAPTPGQLDYVMGLVNAAQLIVVLPQEQRHLAARRCMKVAENLRVFNASRAEALIAIAVLGDSLASSTRRELYDRAMRLSVGDSLASRVDSATQRDRLLYRIAAGLWRGRLEVFALEAAARLAKSEAEVNAVVDSALPLLASSDEEATDRLARLLSGLSGPRLATSVAALAGHPQAAPRALAAMQWVNDRDRSTDLGVQLAHDPHVLVRTTLAHAIARSKNVPLDGEVASQLLNDDAYSVRSVLIAAIRDTEA